MTIAGILLLMAGNWNPLALAAVRPVMVPNASFEDGENFPVEWYSEKHQDAFKIVSEAMHGEKSLRATAGNIDELSTASLDLDLPEGEEISVGLWVKVTKLDDNNDSSRILHIFIQFVLEDLSTVTEDVAELSKVQEWKWMFKKGIGVPKKYREAKFFVAYEGAAGEAFLDRIVIVKGDELPPETVSTSLELATQSDRVKTSIQSAMAAMQDNVLEFSTLEKDYRAGTRQKLQAVMEARGLIQNLVFLVDEMEQEAKGLAEKATDKPLTLQKAKAAEAAAADAKLKIAEASQALEEAFQAQLKKTTSGFSAVEQEQISAERVDTALKILQEIAKMIVTVEAAATKPMFLAGTWGGGVYKLAGAGTTGKWSGVSQQLPQPYLEYLAADNTGNLYSGGTNNFLYKSEDNGITWSWTPTELPIKGNGLAIDPAAPERWLITSWGEGVRWSKKQGIRRSWTREPAPSLFMRAPRAIRTADVPQTTYYAIADGTTIVRARKFQGAWEPVATMPRDIQAWDLVLKPGTADTLVVATDIGVAEVSPDGQVTFPKLKASATNARSLAVENDRVLIGTAGHGVIEWVIPAGDEPPRSAAINTDLDNQNVYTLVLSTHPKPASLTQPAKRIIPKFWTDLNEGLQNVSINSLAVHPNDEEILFCATEGGFYKSNNGGQTWIGSNDGLDISEVGKIIVDKSDPDVIYVASGLRRTFGFPQPPAGGFYKSTDGGKTWEKKEEGLTNLEILYMDFDPNDSSVIYANALGSGIFKTDDGADTWSEFTPGMSGVEGMVVVAGQQAPNDIFAGTLGSGLYKFNETTDEWAGANKGLSATEIFHLAQDPFDGDTWLVGTALTGVFKTTNGGKNWRRIDLPVQAIYRIAYNPVKPGVVFLGSSTLGSDGAGVFRSTDGGETWADDNAGLFSLDIAELVISPEGTIYVGTANGVYYKRAD